MIAVLILLVLAVGFVIWDRSSPPSATPDTRIIAIGAALAVVGLVGTLLYWWLLVPVVILLAGASMIVIGRHRVRAA